MYQVEFVGVTRGASVAGRAGSPYRCRASVSVCPLDDREACALELSDRFQHIRPATIHLLSVDEPAALKYASPDTVAQYLDGVCGVSDLAARLWALSDDHQPPKTETPEPFRASWWSSLSLEDQHNLAELVKADSMWS